MGMTDIKVHKSGEDLLKQGVGVNIKDGFKVLVKGAVIRIEVQPSKYNYTTSEPDYKVSIWIPSPTYAEDKKKGGKQFEVNTKDYTAFKDFMAAVVEAATGSKPKNGYEKVEVELFGFGMELGERERDSTETIKNSVDPLEEKLPTLPLILQKAETKANLKVTLGGKTIVSAKGHDGSCNCDECRAVRATLRELVSGKSPWLGGGMNNDDFDGVA